MNQLNLNTKVTICIRGDRYVAKIDKITSKFIVVWDMRFPKPEKYNVKEIIKIHGIGEKGRYYHILLNTEDPYLDPSF